MKLLWGVVWCAAVLSARTPDEVVREMLRNFHENGFNTEANGLYVNWRTGTKPLQVNLNGTGNPDGLDAKMRHDVLTDLRYLHNLLLWKKAHSEDHEFDADVERFSKIVKEQFSDSHNERGWVYDELIDMYRVSKDEFYREAARNLTQNFATVMYKEPPGLYYKTGAKDPRGYYRVDLNLEMGCALVQAGVEFRQPEWVAKGRQVVDFVYQHAYLERWAAFPTQMGAVLLGNGKANPNQTFRRDPKAKTAAEGGAVRMGSTGQIITALLHAYEASQDRLFLDRAQALLDALTPEKNLLKLWDPKHLGYYASAVFPGPDYRNAGLPEVKEHKKESGRQMHMLEAVVTANRLTGNQYSELEEALVKIALEKAYLPEGRGVPYEQAPDWSLLPMKNGTKGDWVTTEAMGITMEALQFYTRGRTR